MTPTHFMVFDVESIGLHGEGFAVGWVVIDGAGQALDSGYEACPPEAARGTDEDRQWIAHHVVPALRGVYTQETPEAVRTRFWDAWTRWRSVVASAALVADCAWPVEARFLAACVDDNPAVRAWQGPYPLHDVATARTVAGLDPLATVERLPAEEPPHHPTADALQSARLWVEALRGQGIGR